MKSSGHFCRKKVSRKERKERPHIRKPEVVRGFESQVYRRDGSRTWISEHALAIKDAAGNLVGFQGTTLDVTERKVGEIRYGPALI